MTTFTLSWQRFIPFIGFHHVLMILLSSAIILLSILLAGCSSYSTMTNIYIMSLSYQNTTTTLDSSQANNNMSTVFDGLKGSAQLEVRAGYFGLCVRHGGIIWVCGSDTEGLVEQIGRANDPLNLIWMASKFRDDVIFSGVFIMGIVLAFVAILLLGTFPGWHEEDNEGSEVEVKPFPSRPVSHIALTTAMVSALLCLTGGLWQHVGAVGAAAMAESAGYGSVKAGIGAAAMALGWSGVGCITAVALGLGILVISITLISNMIG
ncbi:Ca2+ regulator and membrane fusion protein Fig1-domain-containing protein [Lineolata rhizophorae]|uniref:Ca2+ regulator and membrane fusion protein Fig1-domain-containing protein n=1 Tax=Lineolata rhizophorae TaxID=578093 RepID=A0A6A6PC66_9PEZI|nr:Ca2+ regulator and membrane fusion protein Fig1-domain-containing protein [Lineolata rhizophorae]